MRVVSIENKIIKFQVTHQQLKRLDETIIVNKLRNILFARFEFKEGWDDLSIFAIFKNECESYCLPILVENGIGECEVPHEVLEGRSFKLTLFGGDLLTTNELTLYMVESGYTTDISSTSKASPDTFVYIFNELKSIEEVLETKSIDGHKHNIEDVNNLRDELDDIYDELNTKSTIGHTHISEDVTDLEESTDVNIKRALKSLTNSIRTYGEL